MGKEKAIEICRNIQHTLDKESTQSCYTFLNPMFDKPQVHSGALKRKQKDLMTQYNINKEEL